MGRDPNYYDNRLKDQESQAANTPQPAQPANYLDKAISTAETKNYAEQAKRSTLSYVPQVIAEMATGERIQNWTDLNLLEKSKSIYNGIHERIFQRSSEEYAGANYLEQTKMNAVDSAKLTLRMLKGAGKAVLSAPKEIAKAAVAIGTTPLELEDRALNAWFGNKRLFKPIINLPGLGEIKTAGAIYDENLAMASALQNGKITAAGRIYATIAATGYTANNALMTMIPLDIANFLTRPKFRTVITEKGVDPRALVSKQIKTPSKSDVVKFGSPKQNPSTSVMPMTKVEAAEFGGTPNNIFRVIKPKGNGLAEMSIVRRESSLTELAKDYFLKKFGREKVIRSGNGLEVKLYSEDIKYDANFFNKQKQITAGESVVSASDLAVAPGKQVYHGTTIENKASIIKNGFIPSKTGVYGEGVYFGNKTFAAFYGESELLPVSIDNFNLIDLTDNLERRAFLEKMGLEDTIKNTSLAVKKDGQYDGFVIKNPDPKIGEVTIITNNEKLNEQIKIEAMKPEESLIQEAKKYKSAEEFVKAQGKNNPLLETAKDFENADDFISFYRGSSTQYGKYRPEIRKFGTTEESIRVPELGVDPEKKITIYRGIDTVQGGKMRGTINDGDFVTTDFDAANAYTGGKVVSKEVKAKDLILDYPEKSDFENPFYKGAEFIYSDSKNQIVKRSDADLGKIFDEAKSYQIKIPITEWEKQATYIQKNGKIPPNADLKGYSKSPEYNKYGTTERQRASAYYEYVSNKIDESVKTKSQLTDIWNKAQENVTKNGTGIIPKSDISKTSADPFSTPRPEVPSIMARPLKGFETSLATDKQVDQVIGLSKHRNLDDVVVQSISKTLTGKDNIFDLTQKELYDVSEQIRSFPDTTIKPDTGVTVGERMRNYFMLPRNWMSYVELRSESSGIRLPLDTEVRTPIENGIRLSRLYRDAWNDKFSEVFGEYVKPKYSEERRLISAYIQGEKNAIISNTAIDETTKLELSEIGDWMIDYFKKSFEQKDLGITYTRFFENYLPQIRKAGGIHLLYKEADIPAELKVFAQYEREGQFNALEDDAFILAQVYANAIAKTKFIKEPYENAVKAIQNAPPEIAKRATDWIQEVTGKRDDWEKAINEWGKNISQKTGGLLPENISQQTLKFFMNNSYAGALGLPRFMPIVRNIIGQSLIMPYALYGPRYFKSILKAWSTEGVQEVVKRGFNVKSGVIYGAEMSEEMGKGVIGKGADYYAKLNEATMVSEGLPDLLNRASTLWATLDWFTESYGLLKEGKITWDQFRQNFNMDRFSPTVQSMLAENIAKGTPESIRIAEDLAIKEDLDQIQFGYRKGAGSAFHHGLKGKVLGQFSLYTWGYVSMMREWIVRKQWDKIIRLLAMGATVKRSFEETVGVDISKWIGIGALNMPISPMVRMAIVSSEGINNAFGSMTTAFNENAAEMMRSLKIFGGVATGIGAQRWGKVLSSIKEYESGTPVFDPMTGKQGFPLRSANGKVTRVLDFSSLLKYGLGFEDVDGNKEFDILDTINKNEAKIQAKEDEAMKYFIEGNFDKFTEIYIKNQLSFDPADRMDSYTKGILQRVFERMGAADRAKYYKLVAPLIYGEPQ